MSLKDANLLLVRLKLEEGFRQMPYRCTAGKLTIGYGHNLDANGISVRVAEFILMEDVEIAERAVRKYIKHFDQLSAARQAALVDMCFQLGEGTFSKFILLINSVNEGHFSIAAAQALQSKWAKQTPSRAQSVAKMLEEG